MGRAILPFALSKLLAALVAILCIFLYSRLLAPSDYGVYATIISCVVIGQTIGFFWLMSGLTRFYAAAQRDGSLDPLLSAVWAGYRWAVLLLGLVWALCLFGFPQYRAAAALGFPLLVVRAALELVQVCYRVERRPWRYAAVEMVQGLGAMGGGVLAIHYAGHSAATVLAGMGVGSLPALLLAGRETRGMLQWRGAAGLRPLIHYGWPLAAGTLTALVLSLSDRLVIAAMLGPAAAAIYAVGYSIADRAINLTQFAVMSASKPMIIHAFEHEGITAAQGLMRQNAAIMMAVGFPCMIALMLTARPLAALLVGSHMSAAAAAITPWVALGVMISALFTMHCSLAFQLLKRTELALIATAPAALLNVLANLFLLPRYGIVAAAWTTIAAYLLAIVIGVWLCRHRFGIPFALSSAGRTLLACVPLALFLFWAPQQGPSSLCLLVPGGAGIYLLAAWLLNVADIRAFRYR